MPWLRRPLVRLLVLLLATALVTADPSSRPETDCWPGEAGTDPRVCTPNDPDYPRRWEFRSDIPPQIDREKMHPGELALGAIGISLDKAWQVTTGRDDVVIAVLDSGIRWDFRDLLHKLYINPGELPLPQGSRTHDADGNGRFDVRDYGKDPRVGDLNGNGVLDPQDLIRTFSDCEDDDGNGYVDDISGYDFFAGDHCGRDGGDNDPDDGTLFGHGTGIAKSAAAETHNGIGGVGVCPACRVLPVRVGDSFVVDANQFAAGVVFAVNSGVEVITSALGSYNNTPAARSAVDYAYARGVPIIASAADEFSYHHNYPSVYNHSLYVNAIRYNHTGDWTKGTTFWGLNPCTNFGARVWITVPAKSCSSGATSRLGGAAGLLQSAALDAGLGALHAEELYQVLAMTADDLDNTEPDWGEARYTAKPGFDELYGYGRLNAFAAVSAVADGRIPPLVDLTAPKWFAVVSPGREPQLTVEGMIRVPRAEHADYRLEYALGVEPAEEDYRTVARGRVVGEQRGVLGQLDFTKLPRPTGPSPANRAERDRYSVTVRLRAVDDRGLRAEARRSFFVYDDPAWKNPFPLDLGASGEASPLVVDIDGDGRDEIVIPTADGMLRMLHWDPGRVWTTLSPLDRRAVLDVPGDGGAWPAADAARDTVIRGAVVGDLFGDGRRTIVVASRDGRVYAFTSWGERQAFFPVSVSPELSRDSSPTHRIEQGILSQPLLTDLDGRPGAEIVVTALDGHVYVWRNDGKPLDGFPVQLTNPAKDPAELAKLVSTPTVGDIDGDGRPEILTGSNGLREGRAELYAIRATGNRHPDGPFVKGWGPMEVPGLRPDLLPTVATGLQMTPLVTDADGDGDDEVIVYPVTGTSVFQIDHTADGPVVAARYSMAPDSDSRFKGTTFLAGSGSALLADTDRDGALEIYAPLLPFRMLTLRNKPGIPLEVPLGLGGWRLGVSSSDKSLPMMTSFPRRMEDLMIFARPIAQDVNGDGKQEILMGSGGYLLHAFDVAGDEPAGFPKFTGGWIFSAPAVGDLDGDGHSDLVAVTREGYLFVWEMEVSVPHPDPRNVATGDQIGDSATTR